MKIIFFIIIGVFVYADISNILLKLDNLEKFKRPFIKINFPVCINKNIKEEKVSLNIKNTKLVLNAIFNKKALINNKWLKEGDSFNGYQVMKIFPKKVILERENKIIVLKFNESLIKVKK